eukprot:TRINITY_DN9889_c0_g1_i1.p1 TRINITY_DN9889_c0_g1~~TRINITY_DN9889_c0_g1_i1.p1  ORF type:complete len:523 (-),score=65.27 TRINITY_DN9889_c0_g1_i1:409-1977(-)
MSMQLFQQFFTVVKQVTVNTLDSAQVLDLLQECVQVQAGRPLVLGAAKDLLNKASVPYFRILQQWLMQGVLHDPYNEFMIEELVQQESQLSDWNQRYRIRSRKDQDGEENLAVPGFLLPHAKMILHTGKYLNVVRECSQATPQLVQAELGFQRGFAMEIQKAFTHASQVLLDVLLTQHGFLKWLRQLKDFLLVGQSDWLTVFIDHAHQFFGDNRKAEVSLINLRNLLDLAVRSTSIGAHQMLDVQMELSGGNNTEDSGVERGDWQNLDLIVKVPWPLSIAVGQQQLKELRRIFSHLFIVKFVEWRLCHSRAWISSCERIVENGQECVREAMVLHHHMSYFVRQYLQFMTCEVIESAWSQMEEKVRQAQNLEQVLDSLGGFVSRITSGCLIDQQLLRLHVHTLMKRCQDFCDNLRILDVDVHGLGLEQPSWQNRNAYAVFKSELKLTIAERIKQSSFSSDLILCRERYYRNYGELIQELNKHYTVLAHGEGVSMQRSISREEIDHLHNFIQRVQEVPKGANNI